MKKLILIIMILPFLGTGYLNAQKLSKNALVGSVGTYITNQGIFPGYME